MKIPFHLLRARVGWCLPATALGLAFSTNAHAVPCDELALPNPIYGAGGSAATVTIGKVAAALAGLEDPITILYADPGACIGYQAFLDNAGTTTLKYWAADGTQLTCDPPITGQELDFAHMGNPADECAGLDLPASVGDFLGPVQTLNLVTSIDSSETSISAEAAYFAFGFGANSEAPPWTVEANLARRSSTSFIHLFAAAGIGLSPESFLGSPVGTQQESIDLIVGAAATDPDSTLGYVSGSAADDNRATIKTLAYQHTGQSCGYWPDSTAGSFDKINVRTGLYHFWTPGHFFARVDEAGDFEDPRIAELVGWFQGTIDAPGDIDATALIIDAGDIPGCAMEVTRSGITGAIRSYAPDAPCACLFESIATGETSCTECSDDADCADGGGTCRQGFCEAY
jgi:hypothetical protein